MLRHKDYTGYFEFDEENEFFHGEVMNIRDVITFQGDSIKQIKKAFIDSVEDYLAFCEESIKSPE